MDGVLDFSFKRDHVAPDKLDANSISDAGRASAAVSFDITAAISSLLKHQPTPFASNASFDPSLLLALTNLKYPMGGYTFPQLTSSIFNPPLGATSGNLPLASTTDIGGGHDGLNRPRTNSFDLEAPPAKRPNLSQLLTEQLKPAKNEGFPSLLPHLPPAPPSPPLSSSAASSGSSASTQNSPISRRISDVSASITPRSTPQRKPPQAVPDEKKDNAYLERRRKNNDAAKRSRDARRVKEEQTAAKAALLEQENIQLKSQISVLQSEIAKLRVLLVTCSAASQPLRVPLADASSNFSTPNEEAEESNPQVD
ncbi:Cell death specification protein 2 [Aphelenchoides avenae]|nr:Cell death specification protein 2 [Aphelenchus avenae]